MNNKWCFFNFCVLIHFISCFQDSKKKLASAKVRRSLMSASNNSLSIDDVRREINKHIKQLKPQSLCTPSEKVCVSCPPGKKGSRGSRGRRGEPGNKGEKGAQGIMGPPGRHGKQGIMGDPGIKGEKGEEGIQKESFYLASLKIILLTELGTRLAHGLRNIKSNSPLSGVGVTLMRVNFQTPREKKKTNTNEVVLRLNLLLN